ncbi:MAG: aminotransferase class I/II-fold pyridoxal phosphate-dependent enzyme, partial [Acidobacteriia bacterium]|nr:aminotransferase class I/II-fold pyridoxal phosphate-dependent enzyme [Terriglobia bacterium]
MHHLVIEGWSRKASPLHARDARAKLGALLVFLVAVSTTPVSAQIVFYADVALLTAAVAIARLPVVAMLKRAALLLPFVATFALVSLVAGQPDEGIAWIKKGFNKYTPTQGIPELREKIAAHLKKKGVYFEEVMVTAGVTGGLLLASLALINPGDEVIIPDPFFVMYEYQVLLMGGVPVFVDTYPDFRLREEEIIKKLSKRTKF